jgi:hypothetical protein
VTGLLVLPVVGCDLCTVKNFLKSRNHLCLEVAEVVLYGALESEISEEWNKLLIFSVHTHASFIGSWAFSQEFNAFKTIEAIADVLVDLLWVVSV